MSLEGQIKTLARGLDNSAQGILDINLKNYTLDELDRFINYHFSVILWKTDMN